MREGFSAILILGVVLAVLVLGTTIYLRQTQKLQNVANRVTIPNKITKLFASPQKPQACVTGPLSGIENKDFVNALPSPQDFYEQIQDALNKIRNNSTDYKLQGILYSSFSNLTHFYFVSVIQEKVITTDGVNILYSGNEPYAANRGIVEDGQIKLEDKLMANTNS